MEERRGWEGRGREGKAGLGRDEASDIEQGTERNERRGEEGVCINDCHTNIFL